MKQLQRAQLDKLLGKKLKRAMPLQRAEMTIDEEARTVEMSFSSDEPIEHWFGRLILNHKPDCIRLDRLNNGGAFLSEHDRTKQIGVHVDGTVKTDGHKMRGTVRFSRSPLGDQEFQDVIDGIRRHTSVGAMLHELHFVRETDEEGPVYQSDDWEPIEDSLVSVPADVTTGVGRALDDDEEALAADVREQREEKCACDGKGCDACKAEREQPTQDSGAEGRANQQPTLERSAMEQDTEILQLGEALGETELARDFVANSTGDLAAFKRAVAEKRRKSQTPTPTEDPAQSAERNGGESVQIARGAYTGGLKSFRGKDAAKTAYRFGMFMIAGPMARAAGSKLHKRAMDFCREQGILLERAHSESDNESGGFLVPTEFEAVMIDLRELFGVFRRFANVVPMASDSKTRPRRKGGLLAKPVGAKGASRRGTESKKKWDLVELFARKWMVLAKYEEELSEDAVISMADDLAYEIAYAFSVSEDECGFIGDGSGDYHGIVGLTKRLRNPNNAAVVPTLGHVASLVEASDDTWDGITRADFLKVIGRLPQYADGPNARWFCSKTFWAEVMVRIILEAGGVTAAEVEGARVKSFMGYQVEVAQVLPKSSAVSQIPVVLGDLRKSSMFGDRRGITIKLTDSNDTDFEEDLMSIKGTQRFDINNHDVGNVAASADDREPGPVIGLITKAA